MTINFYLPGVHLKIMGGYKVVYQYANYCAEKGNIVRIYYDEYYGKNGKHIPPKIAILLKKIIIKLGYPRWFKLNKNIKQYAVPNFDNNTIQNADVSVATAIETSFLVSELGNQKGEKFYFVQGFENWNLKDNDVYKSYNLPMRKIAISSWLKEIIDEHSQDKTRLIRNGINMQVFNDYGLNREKYSIAMLYSDYELKGSKYGLEAIYRLKRIFPSLKVYLYGSPKKPNNLPKYVNYKHKASEKEIADILNKTKIFICTSFSEGFGLPGIEAMACGCALVTTNCEGIMEYANNTNARLYNPGDVDKLVDIVKELFNDDENLCKLAKKGYNNVKKNFNISTAGEEFHNYITKNK